MAEVGLSSIAEVILWVRLPSAYARRCPSAGFIDRVARRYASANPAASKPARELALRGIVLSRIKSQVRTPTNSITHQRPTRTVRQRSVILCLGIMGGANSYCSRNHLPSDLTNLNLTAMFAVRAVGAPLLVLLSEVFAVSAVTVCELINSKG